MTDRSVSFDSNSDGDSFEDVSEVNSLFEDDSVRGSCAEDENNGTWCCVQKVSSGCYSADNSVSGISTVVKRVGWEDRQAFSCYIKEGARISVRR